MGQANKRSSLSLDEKAVSLFNVAIDTNGGLYSTKDAMKNQKRIQSTPTPTDYQQEGDSRRRSKSSLPALATIKKQVETKVPQKGYMKGRRPRKDSDGEADQANHENKSPTTPTEEQSTNSVSKSLPKRKSTVHKLFKKKPSTKSPLTPASPSVPTTLDELAFRKGVTGSYIHDQVSIRRAKKHYNSERLRSRSAPVIYSPDRIQVVGGHLHKRDETDDPHPEIYITITPPPPEENTLTANKYSSPYIVHTVDIQPTSSKILDEEPYIIVLDEQTTYIEKPLTKKVGPIMKKKKEKLREMVQIFYLQRDEMVSKTRRDTSKNSRRR